MPGPQDRGVLTHEAYLTHPAHEARLTGPSTPAPRWPRRATKALAASLWAVVVVATVAACNPVFNWREVRPGSSGLTALLPCKPDRAERDVVLGGDPVALQMVGCEAGGATFTIAWAVARDPAQATAWLSAWKTTMANKLQALAPVEVRADVRGSANVPAPLRWTAEGSDATGHKMAAHVWWFAQTGKTGQPESTVLYQATVLGQPVEVDAAATFFESLRLP